MLDARDIEAARGRIEWSRRNMPVLGAIARRFGDERPFEGLSVGVRLHLEPKTAVLIGTLMTGGARITAMGNRGTTQEGTAGVLRTAGVEVLDHPGDTVENDQANLRTVVATRPDLILDNGGELILASIAEEHFPVGATEETTSGAIALRNEHDGEIPFPVLVVNDSPLKSIVENKHGVGESVVDAVANVTNVSLHQKRVVVFGYGWCGRGIADYARGRGAHVGVIEPDDVKLLEAAMDGYDVSPLDEQVARGQIFITATGVPRALTMQMMRHMGDGAILANAGHVGNEIDLATLAEFAREERVSPSLTRHQIEGGPTVYVVAGGGMVNLAAEGGRGNPIEAMDLGFSLQARCLEVLARSAVAYPPGPQPVPDRINRELARAVLETFR